MDGKWRQVQGGASGIALGLAVTPLPFCYCFLPLFFFFSTRHLSFLSFSWSGLDLAVWHSCLHVLSLTGETRNKKQREMTYLGQDGTVLFLLLNNNNSIQRVRSTQSKVGLPLEPAMDKSRTRE